MKTLFISIISFIFLLAGLNTAGAAEQQVVAGAGPSTKIVELFFDKFAKLPEAKGYQFEIPPKSVKHAGGIKCSDRYIFGRTGRPLNDKEKGMNKDEIFLAQIPIAIVVGSGVGLQSLTLDQLEGIMTGRHTNWKAVGGPDAKIDVIGREKTEALFTILKAKYPFFESATFTKIFRKDNQIVSFMTSPNGKYAISFGAKPNFENTQGITILSVDSFSAGVHIGLVYDQANKDHPLINAVKSYVMSDNWIRDIKAAGYMPPQS